MKTTFLKKTPYLLTYSRLLIALYYVLVALFSSLQNPIIVSLLLIYAILSDVFDGIIARKLKTDNVHLRQLDSKVDTIFWITLLFVLSVMENEFMRSHALEIFILLGSEIALQLAGYFKFKQSLALHTYAAKAWAVSLTLAVLQILLGKQAEPFFYIAFVWGLITQLEIVFIIMKMKAFKADVKSLFLI